MTFDETVLGLRSLIEIRRGDMKGMEMMASYATNPIDSGPWGVALEHEKQHLLVLESALDHLHRAATEAWGDEAIAHLFPLDDHTSTVL